MSRSAPLQPVLAVRHECAEGPGRGDD